MLNKNVLCTNTRHRRLKLDCDFSLPHPHASFSSRVLSFRSTIASYSLAQKPIRYQNENNSRFRLLVGRIPFDVSKGLLFSSISVFEHFASLYQYIHIVYCTQSPPLYFRLHPNSYHALVSYNTASFFDTRIQIDVVVAPSKSDHKSRYLNTRLSGESTEYIFYSNIRLVVLRGLTLQL